MNGTHSIFVQVGELIENQIIDGSLLEGARVPSSNELAAAHRINPATALKGLTRLVDAGLLSKQRGVGMFVVAGAHARLLAQRREAFSQQYVDPLVIEAEKLAITPAQLADMVQKGARR